MCLAVPGRIVEFARDDRALATVEVSSVRRTVNVQLLEDEGVEVGDWVLIHVGFAMAKVSESDAAEQMRLLESMGETPDGRQR